MDVKKFQKVKLTTQFDVATERKNIQSGQNLSELLGRQALINENNVQIYDLWSGVTAPGGSVSFELESGLKPNPDALLVSVCQGSVGDVLANVILILEKSSIGASAPITYHVIPIKSSNTIIMPVIGLQPSYEKSKTSTLISYYITIDRSMPGIAINGSSVTGGAGMSSNLGISKVRGIKFGV